MSAEAYLDCPPLQAWREYCAGAELTPQRIEALGSLTREMVLAEEVGRLKTFARDTAAVNPNLLRDVESGLIGPCGVLTSLMDWFYANRAEATGQLDLFTGSAADAPLFADVSTEAA